MKTFLAAAFACLLSSGACFSQVKDVLGYWQVVEDALPESVVLVYEYKGAVYGRMIALYDDGGKKFKETIEDPKERAQGLPGKPYIVGLDFIWKLTPDSGGLLSGTVIDPDSGRSFSCDLRLDKKSGKLVMRGRLLFFSQSQYWPPIREKDLPPELRLDLSKIVPKCALDG